jgi:hypothetical protein
MGMAFVVLLEFTSTLAIESGSLVIKRSRMFAVKVRVETLVGLKLTCCRKLSFNISQNVDSSDISETSFSNQQILGKLKSPSKSSLVLGRPDVFDRNVSNSSMNDEMLFVGL